MYAQHPSNPQQRRNAGIRSAGFDVLVGRAADTGGQENALLGAVLAESFDADAVADGAAFLNEPGVVIGQAGHSTYALPKIIVSQPGKPGIM
jgi:hypothetical protein